MKQSYTEMLINYESAAEKLMARKQELKEQMPLYAAAGNMMQVNLLAQRMEILTDEYCEVQAVIRALRPYAEREEVFAYESA